MNQSNMFTFLTRSDLCIFCLILLSRKSSADYLYEACLPKNCGNGLNVTFPFYIHGFQESYCGYPGFELHCTGGHGYPTIRLPEDDYIVENISYSSRSFRVYNSAVLSTSNRTCLPQIRNITLPIIFDYVNIKLLYLLSNCTKPLPENLLRYEVACGSENRDNWDLAIWDKDENLHNGLENCRKHLAAPVDAHGDDHENGMGNYMEIIKRGFELNWTASDCSKCQESGGRCGFNTTTYQFRCFCPVRPHSASCPPGVLTSAAGRSKLKLIAGVSAAVIVLFSVILFAYKRRKYMLNLKAKMQNHEKIELFLKNNENLKLRRYNHSDLKRMTNSFTDNIGEGGFASVYRGKLTDGRLVAVKILKELKGNGEEFINEVASISRTSHVNVVTLLGFCFEGSKRALIYEFMPNGSLEKFICSNTSIAERQLGWEKLFQIAIGIAKGIEYLHQGCNTRILHFDIKPHNILLDKEFIPKISDFGLAKLCPNRSSIVSMSGYRGTIGYIAPEIVYGNVVSSKSDVYSYGMMILEMVGETKNTDVRVDRSSEKYFPDWIYEHLEQNFELDFNRVSNEDELLKRKMVIVGLWCIQTDPTTRPSTSRVIEMLEGNMESLQIPPKPYFLQPRAAENFSTAEASYTSLLGS